VPHRWWIAGTGGKPPRESSRYERARVASLVLQNAIRDARTLSSARDEAPAATASAAARTGDHNHEQTAAAPHAVDHPDRDAALSPAQQAAAIQAHQQAAMPEEYLEGRTTDPATWMRTPENLARLAALTKAAEARSRTTADGPQPQQPTVEAADPRRQEHEEQHQRPGPEQGVQP
jgi:FtsZ-interacting cell division protein ZipA